VLLAVIFMLFLLMVSLSVALPKIAKEIQRDREVETMQRGKQYARGVKMYYKKFQRYPPNIDALVKTNEMRFLRKKYKDPTTGKEEWKPIMLGQNKAPTAMGFFGQPMAGTTMAGVGPGGGNNILGASSAVPVPTDPSAGTNPPDPNNPTPNPTDPTGAGLGASAGGVTNPTGPTFGGAGIIGFSPMSPKSSILVYKKKSHYSEWEFVFDPLADQMMLGGGTMGGQPVQPGAPGVALGPGNNTPVSGPGNGPGTINNGPGTDPNTPQPQPPQN
jgi:type II secretory pathway pseudopilin PulG